LAPNDPEPHTRAAVLYEQQKDWPNAEREYLAAEKIEHSTELLAGLVHVYQQMNRAPEAEAMLREYLKLQPTDAEAHLQLGRLLLAQGKKDEAVKEFAVAHAGQGDPATQRRIAAELVEAKAYAHAASIYRELVTQSPQDADLRHRYGSALLHTNDVTGAEKELVTAANLNSKNPEILGSLAIAASQNNHFELAIKALDARTKITADTPATYFLRATSYDHLRQYKPAAENYRLFLAAANGAYPDEEWKARHRLIAIEPDGGKKKK
jgi:tetratricopeptide (TPR) repeat protein